MVETATFIRKVAVILETAEKEVQDTSCRRTAVSPSNNKSPKIGGLGGCLRVSPQSPRVRVA